MIKKHLKKLGVFLFLLLVTVMFLLIASIPLLFPCWNDFLVSKGDSQEGDFLLIGILIVVLSVFVFTFMRLAIIIIKGTKVLNDTQYTVFTSIDRSVKGCNSFVYGYNVPMATIKAYYSSDGEIDKLISQKGVEPLLNRRQQLNLRSHYLGDMINCIAALLLSLVAACITGMREYSPLILIISIVAIAATLTTLFLRPVLAEKVLPKFDDEVREYELKRIDEILNIHIGKLNLDNPELCGEKNRLQEIRRLQEELDMTKCPLKQRKIRNRIRILETGGEIPKMRKQSYEKYKPKTMLCILIIVSCVLIRFAPISTGSSLVDEVINDFAVGAAASTWVAFLIEKRDCKQKNTDLDKKKKMVYAEYTNAISDLRFFVARGCKEFAPMNIQLTFRDWLSKLSDVTNYPNDSSPEIALNRKYRHIFHYVRYVKTTLISLRQQFCSLVESNIVDTDDLRQHISNQIRLCDDICDTLEIGEFKSPSIELANDNLSELESAFRLFLQDSLEEKYSHMENG